ncbi:choline dehydrogenase [Xylariaceae sp. FL1019]|nr:choline dehydrogenase [Xylariaceae sp. FL1019]
MRSLSYLALMSALAPINEAKDLLQYGPDLLIPIVESQVPFDQTGPTLPIQEPPAKEYEYIVIGSGSGGSPVAANLARAGHTVLLIDAGGDYGHLPQVEAPAFGSVAAERNEVTWGYFTHHYSNETMALKDRKITWLTPDNQYYSGLNVPEGSTLLGNYYPRYGGLGGCTEHNILISLLPSRNDMQYIANLTGDSSWELDNMRKYLVKLENALYPDADESIHGHDGYINMEINPEAIAAQDIKLMALLIGSARAFGVSADAVDATEKALNESIAQAINMGIDPHSQLLPLDLTIAITEAWANVVYKDANTDASDRDTARLFTRVPESMDNVDYRRSSPRDYVYNTTTAKNSDGRGITKVTFVTHNSSRPRADGVEYLFGESLYRADPRSNTTDAGKPGSVKATKEVIVSGGTFNSPQILKLSGVGPREELEKFGIPVVHDLPGVGTNLQDRLEISVNYAYPSNFTSLLGCAFLSVPGDMDPCWTQYADVNNRGAEKGTYASTSTYYGAFFPSSYSEDGEQDIWLGGFPQFFIGYFPGFSSHAPTADTNYLTFPILKAHTRNRAGTVELRSANPRDTPIINFHSLYEGLSEEEADKDLGALVEGMRMAENFHDSIPDIDGVAERLWPPSNYTTDEELREWAAQEAWGHHASCSNPIGADDDPMAVLDGNFRVRGIDGLRVVDASVFPKIPGTFINLSVYLVAEKASAAILSGS